MFRAYDATRERLVAVKLFKLDLPPERGHQLVAEFERLIAADLTHPALAAPLATGISGVSAFLAQEYVAADSLDLAVREYGPAPASSALRVAAQLAGALDFAAAVQITHGALHPRDVLLSSDDTRLTGLGITRALEKIGVVAPVRRPYTAPERIAGAEWDRRADVFSLAALMHELIWGRRVSGLGAKAASHLTEIDGGDLAALKQVFARALAESPDDRFATALEFAEALRLACPNVAIAPEPAPASKRRVARDDEPRLPLDVADEVADEIADEVAPLTLADPAHGFGPADVQPVEPSVARAEASHTFGPPDLDAPVDLEIAPPAPAEPEIVYQPAADLRQDAATYESPAGVAAGSISGHDPDAMTALQRTRSAVWPLVLALVVGIAIGFAGGFFAGSREQPPAAVAAAAQGKNSEKNSELTSQNSELTRQNAEPTSQNAELKTQSSELKTPTAEPKTQPSEISNPKSAPSAPGRILVRSQPAGARVTIDGKDAGVTPAAVRDLARGAHRVRITRDGYAPEERRVVISTARPAQSITVPLARTNAPARSAPVAAAPAARFTGGLAVDSRPAGAKVFMDGTLVGTTPVSLPLVPAGSHAIRLEHDGYRRWSSSVRVVASEQNRVTASLER
ncbi:MAG: hypothetical protein JWL71_2381 [Acidobacteria bacterium]|nr:hypothetical protein [Acidobacteriota bacterium]